MSCVIPQCTDCKFFVYTKDKRYICKAFPEGIPLNFMFRKHPDNDKECNNGVKFERAE